MGALFIFASFGFGAVMFFLYLGAFIIHFTFPSTKKIQEAEWLNSLTKEERKAYWVRERRKKEWAKCELKRVHLASEIRQKWYDAGGEDTREDFYRADVIATRESRVMDYPDIKNSPDRPDTHLLWGSWRPGITRHRDVVKVARPSWM